MKIITINTEISKIWHKILLINVILCLISITSAMSTNELSSKPVESFSISFEKEVSLASFVSNGNFVMVFAANSKDDTDMYKISGSDVIRTDLYSVSQGAGRIFSIPLDALDGADIVSIKKQSNGKSWNFIARSAGKNAKKLAQKVRSEIATDDSGIKILRFKYQADNWMRNRIRFDEKDTGKRFSAFGTKKDANFCSKEESFLDFSVIQTSRGIVLQELSKAIDIDASETKITIHSPYLMRIAPKGYRTKADQAEKKSTQSAETSAKSVVPVAPEAISERERSDGDDDIEQADGKEKESLNAIFKSLAKERDLNEVREEGVQNKKRGEKQISDDNVAADKMNDRDGSDFDEKDLDKVENPIKVAQAEIESEKNRLNVLANDNVERYWYYDVDFIFGEVRNSILGIKQRPVMHGEKFIEEKYRLLKLSDSSDLNEKAKALYDLAFLYFSAELYSEAGKILDIMAAELSDTVSADPRFIMLKDTIAMMDGITYLDELDEPQLSKINVLNDMYKEEVDFFIAVRNYSALVSDTFKREAVKTRIEDATEKYDMLDKIISVYRNHKSNFLSDYSDAMLVKIGLGVIRMCLDIADSYSLANDAIKIAGGILHKANGNRSKLSVADVGMMRYYNAKILLQDNDFDVALKELNSCMQYGDDRLYLDCGFLKYQALLDKKMITKEQYLEHLEELRWRWRGGDESEKRLLLKLADTQLNLKLHSAAMRTWIEIALYLSDKNIVARALTQISEIFSDFFSESNMNLLPSTKIVAFYLDFAEYLPIGVNGDKIAEDVISKFIALDLLDDAANLLEKRIKGGTIYGDTTKALNTLARIYIASGRPEKAVTLLENDAASTWLFGNGLFERRGIYYSALLASGKYDALEKLLKHDYDETADNIMTKLYWKRREWNNLSDRSEPKIYRWLSNDVSSDVTYGSFIGDYDLLSDVHDDDDYVEDFNLKSMSIRNKYFSASFDDNTLNSASNLENHIKSVMFRWKRPSKTYLDDRGAFHIVRQSIVYSLCDDEESGKMLLDNFYDKLPNNRYGAFVQSYMKYINAKGNSGVRAMYSAKDIQEDVHNIVNFKP